jgi:hypothetical protein
VDLDRLSRGEKLIAGSGIALFSLSFVPLWTNVDYAAGTIPNANAWGGYPYFVRLGLLLAFVDALFVVIKATGVKLNLPARDGVVYVVLAAANASFLLIYVVIGPPVGEKTLAQALGLHVNRGILLFVGLALALLQTYGGFEHVRSKRGAIAALGTPRAR